MILRDLRVLFRVGSPCLQSLGLAKSIPIHSISYYIAHDKKGEETWTIPVQGFRYFNVHGPQEGHKGDQASPYHKFTQQAKETGVIKLFENSDQYRRDFVPVSYVVDIHQQFFNVKESGIWNIGLGIAKSFQEVAEEVAAEHNARIEYIPMPENIAKQYQRYTCADLTKLNRTLVG